MASSGGDMELVVKGVESEKSEAGDVVYDYLQAQLEALWR